MKLCHEKKGGQTTTEYRRRLCPNNLYLIKTHCKEVTISSIWQRWWAADFFPLATLKRELSAKTSSYNSENWVCSRRRRQKESRWEQTRILNANRSRSLSKFEISPPPPPARPPTFYIRLLLFLWGLIYTWPCFMCPSVRTSVCRSRDTGLGIVGGKWIIILWTRQTVANNVYKISYRGQEQEKFQIVQLRKMRRVIHTYSQMALIVKDTTSPKVVGPSDASPFFSPPQTRVKRALPGAAATTEAGFSYTLQMCACPPTRPPARLPVRLAACVLRCGCVRPPSLAFCQFLTPCLISDLRIFFVFLLPWNCDEWSVLVSFSITPLSIYVLFWSPS